MNNRGKGDCRLRWRIWRKTACRSAQLTANQSAWAKPLGMPACGKQWRVGLYRSKMQQTCQRKVDTFAKIVFYVESREVSVVNAAGGYAALLRCVSNEART